MARQINSNGGNPGFEAKRADPLTEELADALADMIEEADDG